MGRTAPPNEEGTLASILGPIQEPRDYLPIIYKRLIKLATRWMQEELELDPIEQQDVVVAYNWLLNSMNLLLQEIETERTLFSDNSRNEAVYERVESIVLKSKQGTVNLKSLKSGRKRATFERLESELAAELAGIRAQE